MLFFAFEQTLRNYLITYNDDLKFSTVAKSLKLFRVYLKILTLLYNVTVAEKLHNFRIKSIKYKFYVLKYILYINLLYICNR